MAFQGIHQRVVENHRVKFAKIAASGNGNNAIVAAVAGKMILVLNYNLVANGTVNAKWQADGAGTPVDLTGLDYLVVNAGIVVPPSPWGWFKTTLGKSLDLNLSAGVAVGGVVAYIEIDA